MKAMILAVMTTIAMAGTAHAGQSCANSVSQAKGNGVYSHLMKMSDNRTWLQLERESDSVEVGVGIEGDKFKLSVRGVKVSVSVCIMGANGIRASVGNMAGEVTKVGTDIYDVVAPYSYSGRYIVK